MALMRTMRFSTRYEICQRVLSLMTKKTNEQIYGIEANSEQEKQYKFNVMNRLGKNRALIELRRLEVLPALQIEQHG